jgi:hypothetical protein
MLTALKSFSRAALFRPTDQTGRETSDIIFT